VRAASRPPALALRVGHSLLLLLLLCQPDASGITCLSLRLHCPLQVTAQKFEDPATGEEAITKKLDELNDQIKESFRNLEEDYR
jgi:hypothetical protein